MMTVDVFHNSKQTTKTMLTKAYFSPRGYSFMVDIKIDYFPPILRGAYKIDSPLQNKALH